VLTDFGHRELLCFSTPSATDKLKYVV
jgi:hypothetical protein